MCQNKIQSFSAVIEISEIETRDIIWNMFNVLRKKWASYPYLLKWSIVSLGILFMIEANKYRKRSNQEIILNEDFEKKFEK